VDVASVPTRHGAARDDRPTGAVARTGAGVSAADPQAAFAPPSPPSLPRGASNAVAGAVVSAVDADAQAAQARPRLEHVRKASLDLPAGDLPAPRSAPSAHDASEEAGAAVEALHAVTPVEGVQAIATACGGLFYVLNAALALGLYGDFSAPRLRGIALSPWDLLAWLGRHWFGRAFRRDPLWELLAKLAGRSTKRAPSWRIDPPSHWDAADDWLRAWTPIDLLEYGVDRRGGRLHVLHPTGFALFDVPRDTRLRPSVQARALCLTRDPAMQARLRRRTARIVQALPADPGQRWLHRLADYLGARFARALGVATAHEAVERLCRHPADIRCDASHIHVSLSLSTLPLPVRIAGLDRDPGWIPAAGRDVRFHFS
jgi:hypothetical protein